MPNPFDAYPYSNFHDLNLDYFNREFQRIFAKWNELYTRMTAWEETTDADLNSFKTDLLSDISEWESNFETLFSTTFSDLEAIKTAAENARDAASDSAAAAQADASVVVSEAARISRQTGQIAETAQAVITKINLPDTDPWGFPGQILRSLGDFKTEWADPSLPTYADTEAAVSAWLDAHPEAVTTVEDRSLTLAKFTDDLMYETLNNYITPEMFGCIGDGETDDLTNLQAALEASLEQGTPLYLPAGKTYYISDTLTLSGLTHRLVILGAGSDKSTIIAAKDAFTFSSVDHPRLSGFSIVGAYTPGDPVTDPIYSGIVSYSTRHYRCNDIKISNFSGYGINFINGNSHGNTFTFCSFIRCGTGGINVGYPDSDAVTNPGLFNTKFIKCSFSYNPTGAEFHGILNTFVFCAADTCDIGFKQSDHDYIIDGVSYHMVSKANYWIDCDVENASHYAFMFARYGTGKGVAHSGIIGGNIAAIADTIVQLGDPYAENAWQTAPTAVTYFKFTPVVSRTGTTKIFASTRLDAPSPETKVSSIHSKGLKCNTAVTSGIKFYDSDSCSSKANQTVSPIDIYSPTINSFSPTGTSVVYEIAPGEHGTVKFGGTYGIASFNIEVANSDGTDPWDDVEFWFINNSGNLYKSTSASNKQDLENGYWRIRPQGSGSLIGVHIVNVSDSNIKFKRAIGSFTTDDIEYN